MPKEIKFNIKLTIDGKESLVTASTNVKALAKEFGLAHAEAKKFQSGISKWSGDVMGMAALQQSVNALRGAMSGLLGDSMTFSTAMREANTMAGKGGKDFEMLKNQVGDLAAKIPIARDALAKGLYQVISNGVPEDNWMNYLEASARSSIGGIADVGEVVKVTSTIIKNYGMDWADAMAVQDKIQLTAKNGVTSFEQLAAALPSVTGQASQLGVSLDEMLAVMATLTGVTGNTSEVSTQLASVLTALTKESSKAQKMADAMGISFNAASIKAAGGLRPFLQELDKTVTAYANKTGQLKESIYSKLFGRAEALRLVNGLTGEMADKFGQNIENMKEAAGTIDDAFAETASTGTAKAQMWMNKIGKLTDGISDLAAQFHLMPILEVASNVTIMVAGFSAFAKSLNLSKVALVGFSVAAKAGRAYLLAFGLDTKKMSVYTRVFSMSLHSTAAAATAAKIAIRGLLAATGVGIVLTALGYAVEKLVEYFDNAGDAAGDAAEEFDEAADRAKRVQDAFANEESRVFSDLMTKYQKMASAWKSLSKTQEKTEWIRKHKDAFKELGVSINGIADADYFFVKNGNAVVESIKKRAQAMARLAKIQEMYRQQSELEQKIAAGTRSEIISYKAGDVWNASVSEKDTRNGYIEMGRDGKWHLTAAGAQAKSGIRIIESSEVKELRAELKELNANIDRLAAQTAADAKTDTSLVSRPNMPNEEKKKKKTTKTDKPKTLIADPNTLEDLQNNLEYYEEKLKKVNKDDKDAIATLARKKKAVEDLIEAHNEQVKAATAPARPGLLEETGFEKLVEDKLDSYDKLNDRMQYYTDLLNKGGETERRHATEALMGLEKIRNGWDDVIDAQRRVANEREDLMSLQGLTGGARKRKLSDMGVDGLTSKIKELQDLLDDPKQLFTSEQRKQVEDIKEAYRQLREEAARSFDTFKDGWGAITGVGNAVESVTDAIEEDKSAWEVITSLVDAFIQMYEGISQIVNIVKMFTGATLANAAAKQAEAAATAAGTAATASDIAVTAADTEAHLANTAAKSGEAVAGATASGAAMPFPFNLVAIAAGIAAVIAALAMVSKFATGGIVGGNSPIGDKIFARVNSGEMILNKRQQNRLWQLINGHEMGMLRPSANLGGLTASEHRYKFEIEGRKLVGVLSNETRVGSRSGRRTNIKL